MAIMHDGNVSIKGTKDGLLISLDSAEEWQLVINDLTARIDGSSAFFAGARITVDVGSRPIPKYALRTLKAALERRGLTLSNILSDSQTTVDSAVALDLRASFSGRGGSAPASEAAETAETLPIKSEEDVLTGVMIRKTLRSGRTIHSEGHVVVLGDVNPGAEVIAGGDVVIWGVLRGNVHAGAYGNESAVVCALDMMPTQLRIAGVLYEPPRGAKRTKSAPEIASVRSNQIIMDSWNR
jgi:septum site-determining protein MinC